MANGYCPALLRHINDIAGSNSPGKKMHVSGFLKTLFCCQNSSVSPLQSAYPPSGHIKTLTVKYRERPLDAHVQDEDTCEINRIPVYKEWSLPSLHHKQTSFFITDDEIKQYCEDASATVSAGLPATQMMREHYDLFVEHANILLRSINRTLVTDMATLFGDNVTTGSNAGKVINIARNGAQVALDDGIVALLMDLQENEICESPCIVGGGNFAAYDMSRIAMCCNQAGFDISRLGIPTFFNDRDTQTIWGQDTIGVLAPGSVKFISYNKYIGNFGGQKGGSIFFTIPFPIEEFAQCADLTQCLRDLRFDAQMRYIDCPTTIDVDGSPTVVNRGWQLILSKEFALWVHPTTGFATGDPLDGTNGTLLYFVDNVCDDCDNPRSAYAYGGQPA